VVLRVNCPLTTEWGMDDIAKIVNHKYNRDGKEVEIASQLSAVVLPKVSNIDALNEIIASSLLPDSMPLWAMIETPQGVLNVESIAAHDRIECLVLGLNDLTMELGAKHTADRLPMLYSASRILLAARANGKAAIDGVHMTLGDDVGLEAACVQGRAMGFDGKSLIHPSQIAITNEHFSPSLQEVNHAKDIIDAYNTAISEGKSLAVLEGKLIEALHVEEANTLLEKASLINMKS
jgi:citrate lyase beta subunit